MRYRADSCRVAGPAEADLDATCRGRSACATPQANFPSIYTPPIDNYPPCAPVSARGIRSRAQACGGFLRRPEDCGTVVYTFGCGPRRGRISAHSVVHSILRRLE